MPIFSWADEPTKCENFLEQFRCSDSDLSYEGQADVQPSENFSMCSFIPLQYFEEKM